MKLEPLEWQDTATRRLLRELQPAAICRGPTLRTSSSMHLTSEPSVTARPFQIFDQVVFADQMTSVFDQVFEDFIRLRTQMNRLTGLR